MRMRTKKWAKPELAVCSYYIKDAVSKKGQWAELYENQAAPLRLELGCGKGGFLSQAAAANPDVNFLAVDLSSDMLGITKRKLEAACHDAGRGVTNALITWYDIERIDGILGNGDVVERIYINFCNPWFKPKQYKKRLTHTRQLLKYREILSDNGEIRFKTDDDLLFDMSLKYFAEAGFKVDFITYDLHQSEFKDDYVTEHEEMYTAQGLKTKYLIAKKL